MKTFLISLVILALMITGGIFYCNLIDDTVQFTLQSAEEMEQALQTQDFDGAQQHLEKLHELWHKRRSWLTMMMDHAQISAVDSCIGRVEQDIAYHKEKDAMVSSSILKELLKSLNENEHLTLQNIF